MTCRKSAVFSERTRLGSMSDADVSHAMDGEANMRRRTLSVERMLLSSFPPLLRNCDAKPCAGSPCGSERKSALSGAVGSSPSPSVPSLMMRQTVAMCLRSHGQSSEAAT